MMLRFILLIAFSLIVSIIDIKTREIPNKIIIAMLVTWVILMTITFFTDTATSITMLKDSALGLGLGGGLFLLVYIISKKGLGGGDVKFMAVSGLYLGFSLVIPVIFYSSVRAVLFTLTLIIMKKIKRKDAIPLAPFICFGISLTILLNSIYY
jgi:Flp pilus assembly protein protease CpaA